MSFIHQKERAGFSMKFANGNTVSVQWHHGSYAESREKPEGTPESETAEIAAWNADGDWHKFNSDTVDGWETAEEVATFINFVANNTINT